jgi:hypothetical protein
MSSRLHVRCVRSLTRVRAPACIKSLDTMIEYRLSSARMQGRLALLPACPRVHAEREWSRRTECLLFHVSGYRTPRLNANPRRVQPRIGGPPNYTHDPAGALTRRLPQPFSVATGRLTRTNGDSPAPQLQLRQAIQEPQVGQQRRRVTACASHVRCRQTVCAPVAALHAKRAVR